MPKKKKTKYRKITFKLTSRQRNSLEAYCRELNTTPVRFIKDSIKHALNGNPPDASQRKGAKISSKQIDLEELIEQISEEQKPDYNKRKTDDHHGDLFS